MLIQISSGQGPKECELACGLFLKALQKEYPDVTVISAVPGQGKDCISSAMVSSPQDLSHLTGSIQWICRSPFRPHHGRKNWFIDVHVIPEEAPVTAAGAIRFERFHAGGNGGQNVNKVETGVRLIHVPTGITVTSTAERTQELNRRDAMNKLTKLLKERADKARADQKNSAWIRHYRLERGNPVRVYEGMDFNRKK